MTGWDKCCGDGMATDRSSTGTEWARGQIFERGVGDKVLSPCHSMISTQPSVTPG